MNWNRILFSEALALVCVLLIAYGQSTSLLPNGGFESGQPSLWNAEPGAATLTWATDQVKSGTHSLKIEKVTTGSMARWISSNNVRYWVNYVPDGVDIKLGAWVKTSGVNTSPPSDAEKWQVKFWFYDTLGVLIGGVPFVLDVDQSVATRDWYADTNGVGSVILPVKAYRMLMSAEAGPNAMGTVWFDDFLFEARGSQPWLAENWNGFVDADSGWVYWIAPNGGHDGLSYFPGSGVTTEQARTGSYSLKVTAPVGRQSGELVWISETVPVTAGKRYVLSAWVMTSGINKDSVFNAESQLGFTATFHSKLFTDAGGFNEVGGADYRFTLKDAATGWTQYSTILTIPGNANAVSVRARSWHIWTGTSYWDDFSLNGVEPIVTSVEEDPTPISNSLPTDYKLLQNYPNPFNPSTLIEYSLPSAGPVKLEIFNVLGQKVRTLVNNVQSPGVWRIQWSGRDNSGAQVSSGIYFYRLETRSVVFTRKMVLMK